MKNIVSDKYISLVMIFTWLIFMSAYLVDSKSSTLGEIAATVLILGIPLYGTYLGFRSYHKSNQSNVISIIGIIVNLILFALLPLAVILNLFIP